MRSVMMVCLVFVPIAFVVAETRRPTVDAESIRDGLREMRAVSKGFSERRTAVQKEFEAVLAAYKEGDATPSELRQAFETWTETEQMNCALELATRLTEDEYIKLEQDDHKVFAVGVGRRKNENKNGESVLSFIQRYAEQSNLSRKEAASRIAAEAARIQAKLSD